MSLYRTGTVSIVAGAFTATGASTNWLTAGITAGMSVLVVDSIPNKFATVASVNSNTSITFAAAWTGATVSNAAYGISIDFTPLNGLPLIDETTVDFPALYNAAMAIIDGRLP